MKIEKGFLIYSRIVNNHLHQQNIKETSFIYIDHINGFKLTGDHEIDEFIVTFKMQIGSDIFIDFKDDNERQQAVNLLMAEKERRAFMWQSLIQERSIGQHNANG